MKIWQITAGDRARNYTDLFFKYDVMLIGPRDPVDFKRNPKGYEKEHMKNQINNFCRN